MPKKLLLTKWRTVTLVAKQVIAWREPQDDEVWRQGCAGKWPLGRRGIVGRQHFVRLVPLTFFDHQTVWRSLHCMAGYPVAANGQNPPAFWLSVP